VVQTALTPAFLLVAVGSLLNVLTGRLSRIVDRSRDLKNACRQRSAAGSACPSGSRTAHALNGGCWLSAGRSSCRCWRPFAVCVMIGLLFLMGLTEIFRTLDRGN
jgi:hypothetical protein